MNTTCRLGDLTVGAQGLGCMGMSAYYGAADPSESIATIHRALDRGVTLVDTADLYGNGANERLVGRTIATRREQVVLATKFGIQSSPNDPMVKRIRGDADYVAQACERSLRRLGTDHIDLYYQHRVDPRVPVEETVHAMSRLVEAGKVRYIGLSEARSSTIRRAYSVHPITALQSEWSLWSRDIEYDIVPTCRDLGIGIVAYAPLGRGLLTGRYSSRQDLPVNDFRLFEQPRFAEKNIAHNASVAMALAEAAQTLGCTASQAALAWIHHRGSDVVPIPGTTSRVHLDQNLAARKIELEADSLALLERIASHTLVRGARCAPEHQHLLNQ
jgi:aryl-alcohol dehydrogenase-like predicted oxidoreductase